jgi:hypothetical protein
MQRLVVAMAVIATMLCGGLSTPAQAEFAIYPEGVGACQPLPPWYPRGWELMVRRPCLIYYSYPYYDAPRYPLAVAYSYRSAVHVSHRIHRRPYLRPGWWW